MYLTFDDSTQKQEPLSTVFRTDGNVFNLRRLNSDLRDLLFADDCALLAHTVHDIQAITNAFARSARRFGLTISLKKTEVIYQPKPGADYTAPTITIDNNPLKVTDKFTYLGSTISQNCRRIANIKWQDMIPNTEVLQRCA